MTVSRRQFIIRTGLAGPLPAAFVPDALAQTRETTRLVIGFPAGSTVDGLARALATRMSGSFARSVIVENRPGAGGQLAATTVKKSPADGSVVFVTPMTTLGVFPHTFKSLPYDPVADFVPVGTAASFSFALAIGSQVPASVTTLGQLLEWFKANPAKASIGNAAVGSPMHFSSMLLAREAGVTVTHVGYVGPQMFSDVAGGVLAACVAPIGALLPMHQGGQLRIIATTGETRSPFLPNVATYVEAGFKDLVFREWIGCFLPAGAPADMAQQLNQSLRNALSSKEVSDVLAIQAQEMITSTPAELGALLRRDMELWGQRVRAVGFTSAA